MMGGSPCPVEVMKQVINRMGIPDVTIVYGMTETSPVSTQTHVDDSLCQRVTTVGRVHPHVEVKIVDPRTGATVPRGTEGELCTRGYSVMLGDWREPDKTAEAVDDARWMHTGDLATMDMDGYVNITGRLKDMVIRGGENISPREIEEFLHTHPDIEDVQVVGVPDARVGEAAHGVGATSFGSAGAVTSGAPHVRPTGRLAAFKIPRYVTAIEEFPMTASGKVRKVALRQMAVDLLGSRQIRGRRARMCTQRGCPPQRVLVDIPQHKGSKARPTTNPREARNAISSTRSRARSSQPQDHSRRRDGAAGGD